MAQFIKNFSTIGHKETDSDQIKIQKSFLIFLATFMSSGGLLWGSISLYYGLSNPALIPYGYVLISAVNILYFKMSKNFLTVRFIQVFISLLLPFMFQWSLGGFFPSGLIMLWAILALVASLSFEKFSTASVWLLLFLALTVVSAVYDDFFFSMKPDILPNQSLLFLTLNATVISSIVFGLVMYFVMLNKDSRKELNQSNKKVNQLNSVLKQKFKELERTQSNLKMANQQLEDSKSSLTRITQRQTEINEKLLQERGMILGND